MRRRRNDSRVADEAFLDGFRLPALDRGEGVRAALDLDLETLTLCAERPGRVQVRLPHQPVHPDADDNLAVHVGLPMEALTGNLSGLDHADRRVDRLGGHRDAV